MLGPCMHAYSMRKGASCTTFSCTDSQACVHLPLRLGVRQPVYSNSVTVFNDYKHLGSMRRERASAIGRCRPGHSPRLGQAAAQVRSFAQAH